MRRSSALPMTMFEAERLARIVAPASAASVVGGLGAQKSSQISTASLKPGIRLEANTRSTPNGMSASPTRIDWPLMAMPLANQRFS
jgi:hypothetical protein